MGGNVDLLVREAPPSGSLFGVLCCYRGVNNVVIVELSSRSGSSNPRGHVLLGW